MLIEATMGQLAAFFHEIFSLSVEISVESLFIEKVTSSAIVIQRLSYPEAGWVEILRAPRKVQNVLLPLPLWPSPVADGYAARHNLSRC
ncbi:MAG: hypothetical protein ACO31I_16525 [Prochlorotrichaceae cyanobacterium]|jgi:hypothetical protein